MREKIMDRENSAYEQKVRGRMDELRAEVDVLSARLKQAGADGRIESRKQMERVTKKWSQLEHKLDQLSKSGSEAGREIREGVEAAWDDLASSLRAARNKLQ